MSSLGNFTDVRCDRCGFWDKSDPRAVELTKEFVTEVMGRCLSPDHLEYIHEKYHVPDAEEAGRYPGDWRSEKVEDYTQADDGEDCGAFTPLSEVSSIIAEG